MYKHKEGCHAGLPFEDTAFWSHSQRVLFPQTGQDDLCDRNSGPVLTVHKLYDDFTLASKPTLCDSSRCGMELVFLLAGWFLHKNVAKQLHSTLFARLWSSIRVSIGLKLAC